MEQQINLSSNSIKLISPSPKFRRGFKHVLFGMILVSICLFISVVLVSDIFIKIMLLACTLVASWCSFHIANNKNKFCTLVFDTNTKLITSPLDRAPGNLFPILNLDTINGLCICHSKASGSAHGGGGHSWELGVVDAQDVIFGTAYVENNESAAMTLLDKLCNELNVANLGLIETDFPALAEIDGQTTYVMERI